MKNDIANKVFTSRPTAEVKTETTTRIARQIIDQEAAARDKKTEKLRAARLAQEAEETPEPAVVVKTAKKRVAKAK